MADFVRPLDEHITVRHLRLMPPFGADITLVILKGHLLVEELLKRILQQSVPDPSAIEDARLTFFQVLRLVQAIAAHPGCVDLWPELEQLNRLRNLLAHQIEPADLEKKIDAFLINYVNEPSTLPTMTPEEKSCHLSTKITFLCGRLSVVLGNSPGTEGNFLIHSCPLCVPSA